MPQSAISLLFPAFAVGAGGGKGGKKTPPPPPVNEPIYIGKGLRREDVVEQLQRHRDRQQSQSAKSPAEEAMKMLRGSAPAIGSNVPWHQKKMRLRPEIPTPIPEDVQPQLRGMTPEEFLERRKQWIQEPPGELPEPRRRRRGRDQAAGIYRPDESSLIRSEPVGDTVRNAILLAMANGDTVRSAKLGLDPEVFMDRLWTKYFEERGVQQPRRRAAEFIDIADAIADGQTIRSLHPDLDPLVEAFKAALDSRESHAFDLSDTATRLMSGYGTYPETDLVATQWQENRINEILDMLDLSAVIDYEPFTSKDVNAPYTPDEAYHILETWGPFGPSEIRAKLQQTIDGTGSISPNDVDLALAPMQHSLEARKLRELATSGEKMWTNLQEFFHDKPLVPGSELPGMLNEMEVIKDLAIAVRDLEDSDPRNIKYYYVTRGYEGHNVEDRPKVSEIIYEQDPKRWVQMKDPNAPGGARWVQPDEEPRERRIIYGPKSESFGSLAARIASGKYEVAVLENAHGVIWGGMRAVPDYAHGNWTPDPDAELYDVYEPPARDPSRKTFGRDVVFGLPPEPEDVRPYPRSFGDPHNLVRGSYAYSPMDLFRTRSQSAPVRTERITAIIEGLNEQDMRNVFSPYRTPEQVQQYLVGKYKDSPQDAIAAAKLITSVRASNRRLWDLMELRNLRTVRGELLQNTGFSKEFDIGDTNKMTQLELDEVRRQGVLKFVGNAPAGASDFEQDLVRQAFGVK